MRKVAILLIVASLVYIVSTWFAYLVYQGRMKEQLLSIPEQMRPYVDFAPFTGSREGVLLIIVGSLLSMLWVLYLSRRKKAA